MSTRLFDADLTDPLTARRIAVTSSLPHWCYLVSFDCASEDRPDERETALLASFLEEYKDRWYGQSGFRRKMEQRELDVDGGANGVIFHKWGTDDWGFRRHSFTIGNLWTVTPPWMRDQLGPRMRPFSLLALMDAIHAHFGGEPSPSWEAWKAWKATHPEVFGA